MSKQNKIKKWYSDNKEFVDMMGITIGASVLVTGLSHTAIRLIDLAFTKGK